MSTMGKIKRNLSSKSLKRQSLVRESSLEMLSDKEGLHAAAAEGRLQEVKGLLKLGMDLNEQDQDGWTPLHCAAKGARLPICTFILNKPNVEVSIITNEGATPIHYLVRNSELFQKEEKSALIVLDLLLKKGCDVSVMTKHGETALHCASMKGNFVAANYLLDIGADPNSTTEMGETALHYAIRVPSKELVKLLLDHGANPTIQSISGFPKEVAVQYQQWEIVDLLTHSIKDREAAEEEAQNKLVLELVDERKAHKKGSKKEKRGKKEKNHERRERSKEKKKGKKNEEKSERRERRERRKREKKQREERDLGEENFGKLDCKMSASYGGHRNVQRQTDPTRRYPSFDSFSPFSSQNSSAFTTPTSSNSSSTSSVLNQNPKHLRISFSKLKSMVNLSHGPTTAPKRYSAHTRTVSPEPQSSPNRARFSSQSPLSAREPRKWMDPENLMLHLTRSEASDGDLDEMAQVKESNDAGGVMFVDEKNIFFPLSPPATPPSPLFPDPFPLSPPPFELESPKGSPLNDPMSPLVSSPLNPLASPSVPINIPKAVRRPPIGLVSSSPLNPPLGSSLHLSPDETPPLPLGLPVSSSPTGTPLPSLLQTPPPQNNRSSMNSSLPSSSLQHDNSSARDYSNEKLLSSIPSASLANEDSGTVTFSLESNINEERLFENIESETLKKKRSKKLLRFNSLNAMRKDEIKRSPEMKKRSRLMLKAETHSSPSIALFSSFRSFSTPIQGISKKSEVVKKGELHLLYKKKWRRYFCELGKKVMTIRAPKSAQYKSFSIPLEETTLTYKAPIHMRNHVFELSVRKGVYYFSTETKEGRLSWVEELRLVSPFFSPFLRVSRHEAAARLCRGASVMHPQTPKDFKRREELMNLREKLRGLVGLINREPEISFKKSLRSLLLSDLQSVSGLCGIANEEDEEELAKALSSFFNINGKIQELLKRFTSEEIKSVKDKNTLFREVSLPTRMVSAYFFEVGREYLQQVLLPTLTVVVHCHESLEVNPNRAGPGVDVESHMKSILSFAQIVLDRIAERMHELPVGMRKILKLIYLQTDELFPDMKEVVLGSFVFLRFLCPAIVSPATYELLDESAVSVDHQRVFILISKLLQNLANQVEFDGSKESYMTKCNTFITENLAQFNVNLLKFIHVDEEEEEQGIRDNTSAPLDDKLGEEDSEPLSVLIRFIRCKSDTLDQLMEFVFDQKQTPILDSPNGDGEQNLNGQREREREREKNEREREREREKNEREREREREIEGKQEEEDEESLSTTEESSGLELDQEEKEWSGEK